MAASSPTRPTISSTPGWRFPAAPTRPADAPAASAPRLGGSDLVVTDLDQVPAGVEEVKRLPRPACPGLVARPPHVPHRVKRITVFNSALGDSPEHLVEFLARHREREMLSALGAPRRDLNLELRRDANHRKRLALTLVLEAQDPDVELNRLRAIVHSQDQVVELGSHVITPLGPSYSALEGMRLALNCPQRSRCPSIAVVGQDSRGGWLAGSSILDFFRRAPWLTRRRLVVYPKLFLAGYVVSAVIWLMSSKGLVDPAGHAIGADAPR